MRLGSSGDMESRESRSVCEPRGPAQRHLPPELIITAFCRPHCLWPVPGILPLSPEHHIPYPNYFPLSISCTHSPGQPLVYPLKLKAQVQPGGRSL